MTNIRLFFPKSLSINLSDELDKSQSHYVSKVMRAKENEVFSLFNSSGEWEAKIVNISKSLVEFKITKQLTEDEKYSIFKYICKYITIFYDIHEDEIELALFTNNLISIFN